MSESQIQLTFRTVLARLGHAWDAAGAPVGHLARPGLAGAEIDDLLLPLGLRLPIEARMWWEWHDGTDLDESVTSIEGHLLGPVHRLLSLRDAVNAYNSACELADEAASLSGMAPQEWWDRSWLPVVSTLHDSLFAVDCSVPLGHVTPVRVVEPADEDRLIMRAPSMTEVVSSWADAIASGGWAYDRDEKRWTIDESRLDPRSLRSGLL
jgi:cell wall assembly regulator SMI1